MRRSLLGLTGAAFALASCSTADGEKDAELFDDIAAEETINLSGTEPFWSAEITGDTLTYSDPERIEGVSFTVTRFTGNSGLGFSGQDGEQTIDATVTRGECSDGMSDRTYPFTATLKFEGRLLEGCGYSDKTPFSGPATP